MPGFMHLDTKFWSCDPEGWGDRARRYKPMDLSFNKNCLKWIREEASPRSTPNMGEWVASEGLQGAGGTGEICLPLSYSLLLSPDPCVRHPPGLGDLYS